MTSDNPDYCKNLALFEIADIEILIQSANNFSEISCYPYNPIFSKVTQPNLLGECILWTIEGIKQNTRFPSLEPHLINQETNGRLSMLELEEVYTLYARWWKSYKDNPVPGLLNVDVLEPNNFRWNHVRF
nr:DUF4943 family protein [Gramella sp. KN1008]